MTLHRLVVATVAAIVCCTPSGGLRAQARERAVADSSPFRPLSLPTPSSIRNGAGRPGSGYWQQRVDYRITADLDVVANRLSGRETIHYVNHSPDALPYLWLFLEQNLCATESVTNQLNQPPLVFLGSSFDFSCQGFKGGLLLESVTSKGQPLAHVITGTTMRVDLPAALRSGESLDIDIVWHFDVPPMGGGRMGHDGALYEIAQWYPRVAVYDDVRGWNHEPYIGAGEFYLEYGSFDVTLTVPASHIVAATGQLRNPEQVLTVTQRSRLDLARRSDTAIAIVTRAEAGNPALTRPSSSGSTVWHFTADSVRDFAFAAGPAFRWDASSYDGILIETLYRTSANQWGEANRMAREAIKHFSETWYRYPYSHATTVEGPIEGMEYPMLTFVPNGPSREDTHWVVAHEFGHEWFPMVVGSNERLYPWMDEGFNTFIDLANAAKYFKGSAYGDSIEVHPLHLYPDHARPGNEQPLITKPTEVRDLFWGGYQKPALMLTTLRNEVLGRDRFENAFRDYIRTWAFKHPTPADFFRLMRDNSGMELDWFWRGWIFTTARLDQAIDSVSRVPNGGTVIHLSNRAAMVMPVALTLTLADHSTRVVRLPVEMWNLGDRFDYRVAAPATVVSAEIDAGRALPDINRKNNRWVRAGGVSR